MAENPVRPLMVLPRCSARSVIFLVCCAAVVSGGCSVRKRPSIPWASAVQVRPVTPAQVPETNSVPEDALPELRLELPASLNHLIIVRSAPPPPRPRVNAPPSAGSGNDTEKLESPMLAPPITPQDSVVAQQQANQSLSIAEKNLALTHGKNMNAAQADLVSKIRGFIKDAREAAQSADWIRARSLAKKAQVLSEELAGSL
jgi:hypothetical protein